MSTVSCHGYASLAAPAAGPRPLARRARASAPCQAHPRVTSAKHGPTHPRELQSALGMARVVNGWGGESIATTRMLEVLHYRGHLRIARRDKGVKVYELAHPLPEPLAAAERVTQAARPCVEPLRAAARAQLARAGRDRDPDVAARRHSCKAVERADRRRSRPTRGRRRSHVRVACQRGDSSRTARRSSACSRRSTRSSGIAAASSCSRAGRTGSRAYTPPAKRRLGYYALPLLWRDAVVGWANAALVGGALEVETGFSGRSARARRHSAASWTPRFSG